MKTDKSQLRNYTKLLCSMVPTLILIACNPVESPHRNFIYYSPTDNVLKSIANFDNSYHELNLNEYMGCFRSDFEFYYESNGDTLSWGFDTEQNIHQSMFSQASEIWLTLLGSDQYPWSGDSTGATLVLPRDYSLRVFMGCEDSTGTSASGIAHFICRQDSVGEWYIWQWWDFADAGQEGWSDIKESFRSTH